MAPAEGLPVGKAAQTAAQVAAAVTVADIFAKWQEIAADTPEQLQLVPAPITACADQSVIHFIVGNKPTTKIYHWYTLTNGN